MSKPKENITEGLLDYIGNILKKANNKRFSKKLNAISKSGPAGQKAVKRFQQNAAQLAKDMEVVNKWSDLTDY